MRFTKASPVAAIVMVAGATATTVALATSTGPVCATPTPGVSCTDGGGRQTAGGGAKVSHVGWPAITGVLRMADSAGRVVAGGPLNDELLGEGGSDHIVGHGGDDVIWGDQFVVANGPHQHDTLSGGPGSDWIYPSHGLNTIDAGPGADHVIAYYGHGTIDCGAGIDTAQVRETGDYTLKNCEHITHFCPFGAAADGTCKKPGERAVMTDKRMR